MAVASILGRRAVRSPLSGGVDARLPRSTRPRARSCTCRESEPLRLDCDQLLAPFSVAYQTYGTLNADKSNAILICHALTGDQYVASTHPVTGKPGWWETLVGPGKPIDTDRFFVICPNILGGCMGSTGPASINPKTGKPYGLDFPVITIGDMVDAQVRLHRSSRHRRAVLASSAARWAACRCWSGRRATRTACSRAVPIATAAWHSSQNIAFHEVGRQAVMADPGLARRRLLTRTARCRRTASPSRAWPRTSPTSRRRRCSASSAATCRIAPGALVLLRRRLPGRELPAPPGLDLRRPLRRQQLSLHHAGHGLLRSRGRARRRARQRLPRHQDALLRRLVHQRLALPDAREPRDRAGAQRGRRQRLVRRDRERQGPRRLPARGAGVLRHRARLPQRGRRQARGLKACRRAR